MTSELAAVRTPAMELSYEGSGWDNNGRLYRGADNNLYRIIASHADAFYRKAIENRELHALVADGKLISFRTAEGIGDSGALALQHESISIPTYPFEWTSEMFFRAAQLTLEICDRLLPHGMCLHDANFWNILFRGRHPVFVDFTSIVPLTDAGFDAFVSEFRSGLLSSLDLIRDGHLTLLRRVSRDYGKSIVDDVAQHIVPRVPTGHSRLRKAGEEILMPARTAARRVRRRLTTEFARRGSGARPAHYEQLEALRKAIGAPIGPAATSWGGYYQGSNGLPPYDGSPQSLQRALSSDGKHKVVADIIERVSPASYVDLGCNRGLYAHLASKLGATSVGIDIDEQSLDLMFRDGDRLNSQALPCFADIVVPSAPVGPAGKKWPTLAERCRGELTSCLALAHHLLLGVPSVPTQFLVELLASYTSDWLIFEFVQPEDPFLREAYGAPPASYNLAHVLTQLERYFVVVERWPSSMMTRELIVCRRHAAH